MSYTLDPSIKILFSFLTILRPDNRNGRLMSGHNFLVLVAGPVPLHQPDIQRALLPLPPPPPLASGPSLTTPPSAPSPTAVLLTQL